MSYLYGLDASASPEHAERVSSFISSTYKYTPLMQQREVLPSHTSTTYTFKDTLPDAGNCALGGCGDARSAYYSSCVSNRECGCETPGCDGGFSQALVVNPQRAFSSTDCTQPSAACESLLDFHNCYPALPHSSMSAMCRK